MPAVFVWHGTHDFTILVAPLQCVWSCNELSSWLVLSNAEVHPCTLEAYLLIRYHFSQSSCQIWVLDEIFFNLLDWFWPVCVLHEDFLILVRLILMRIFTWIYFLRYMKLQFRFSQFLLSRKRLNDMPQK